MHISIAISLCLLLLQYKIQTVQCHMSEVPTDLQDDQVVGKTARGFVSSNPQLGEGNKTREPARLRVDGSNLIDPASGQPVTLHGVNWWSGYFQSDDGLDLETELPSANLVRLVGILWDNGNPDTDCRTDDASNGFLSDKCVRHLDNAIKACQRHNVWVVITCRAAEAAGDGYPEDVFHDPDLVVQFETMWRWVAARYSSWEWIAGYEIMSEPRTKITPQHEVTAFYERLCSAVHEVDPPTPCVVGPAPYYKVWQLDEGSLLNDPNVIYTFDFFHPWSYISNETGAVGNGAIYPGDYSCNDVFKGWVDKMCPGEPEKVFHVDAEFFLNLLLQFPLRLQETRPVPIFCNQWGVKNLVPENLGRRQYVRDLANLFEEYGIHSTYWIWRSYHKDQWTGFEMVYYDQFDTLVMEEMANAWS